MMRKVMEINQVIKKPLQVVEKGLAEGFKMYGVMGRLKNIKHQPDEHIYSANFKNDLLCEHIEKADVLTTLSKNSAVNEHTDLKFIINYLPHKLSVTKRLWYNIIFKPQIQFRIQHIIFDFKYRVEKWM